MPISQHTQNLNDLLSAGVERLGLSLSAQKQSLLISYLELLTNWNKTFNLTAIRLPEQMVVKHLLDSLAISEFICGDRVLDVGTGAGLPGLILAIVFPEKSIYLLDSNGKKTRFVNQVIAQLNIENAQVIHTRVERYHSPHTYTTIVSRAFASIPVMVQTCEHLVCPNQGVFLAMKGILPVEELTQLEGYLTDVHPLEVPFLDETRHVVMLRKQGS